MTDLAILLCVEVTDPLMMPDNATGPCGKCSRMLQFRPYAAHMNRICIACMARLRDEGEEIEFELNERMLQEAADFINYGLKH